MSKPALQHPFTKTQFGLSGDEKTQIVDLFRESYDVYVGCPRDGVDPRELAPGTPGFLGNPFVEGTPEENLNRYRNYFMDRVLNDRRFKLAVLSLYGRRLGCICSLSSCHAQVIVQWLHSQRRVYEQYFELPSAATR